MEDANAPYPAADSDMEQAPRSAPDFDLDDACLTCGLASPVEDQGVVSGCEL